MTSTPSAARDQQSYCKTPSNAVKASDMRPKTVPSIGRSYTNRCVREILNKLEHGAYASEWYSFSKTNMPSPKWINFKSGQNGGLLDAFLCAKNGPGSQECYMMDVRIGDKVSRLLKYPCAIRVGRNGAVAEKKCPKASVEDWIVQDEDSFGEEHGKSRPFPLSWNEQIEWKNVSVKR